MLQQLFLPEAVIYRSSDGQPRAFCSTLPLSSVPQSLIVIFNNVRKPLEQYWDNIDCRRRHKRYAIEKTKENRCKKSSFGLKRLAPGCTVQCLSWLLLALSDAVCQCLMPLELRFMCGRRIISFP